MADMGIGESIAIASLALTAVGTATAVAGSIAQGQAAKKAADFNSQVAQNNAKASQDQANYQAQLTRQRGLRILASQRAAAGASGIDLSGSFSDVQSDSAINNELDALSGGYQGNVASGRAMSQSQLDSMSGDNAVTSSYWGAGSSLLTGASKGISQYSSSFPSGSPPPSIRATPAFEGA